MRLRAPVLAVLAFSAINAHAQTFTPGFYANESVAGAEDVLGFQINPAAGGLRYPREFAIAWSQFQLNEDRWNLAGSIGGFGLDYEYAEGDVGWGLSLAGGDPRLRFGARLASLDGGTDRALDWNLGALSRPNPWLSLGAVAYHVGEPQLAGSRFERTWTLGAGLRPLALDRARAFTLGPRLTLTADASFIEDEGDVTWRYGAEAELLPGVVVQGSMIDDEAWIGFTLRAPQGAAHGAPGNDDTRPTSFSVSFHDAEDRTILASPRDRRIAIVSAGGDLGDDAVTGLTIFGTENTRPSAPIHQQLERALHDPLTEGVLLTIGGITGMAQVEELRPRIARLRAAGKPVVAFMEYGGGRAALYLAAACDRIVTTPEARFAALGLRIERRYYRRLLADFGVRLDRSSVGAYKSAYRNYSVDSTGAADRESINDVLDTAQKLFVSAVATDRNLPEKQLLTVLDGRAWRPVDLVNLGVIDTVAYREDALSLAGRLAGLGRKPRGASIGRIPESQPAWRVPRRLAVIYAAGGISEGRSGNDLLLGPYMGSASMTSIIQSAFKNPDVEAVVLRVESPGGTDIASDLIHHALEKGKKESKKPLIVSMGGVAASGGYHIALPGDRIYADRFTRTGSIGVYFLHPSLEGFYEKHRVRQDEFERGNAMRAWSMGRDWDARMQSVADSAIRGSYEEFVGRVARDRNLDVNTVERSAQGRVWMGDAARERKLVDEIGGLEEAIAEARRRAHIPEGEKIDPIEYRRARPILLERLMGSWVREMWERNVRLPEPGQTLRWADDLPPVE